MFLWCTSCPPCDLITVVEPNLGLEDDPTQSRTKRARVDNEWEGWGAGKRITEEPEGGSRAYQPEYPSSCAISTVSQSEPFWWKHLSIEEKRAYASMKVKTSIAQGEIEILTSYKRELESTGHFDDSDRDEFADRIRDVHRRFTTAVDDSAPCVAVPIAQIIE